MLVMTPSFAKTLRKQARREREAMRGRLGKQRFDSILAELVAVIRLSFAAGATGSLFGLEGPLRHAIRSDLCLQGWKWIDAHRVACLMMDEAFVTVRAERPTWYEGQPEWTISSGDLIERTRCVACHKPLPEGHKKYCGTICANASQMRLHRLREAKEGQAIDMAVRST